MLNTPRRWERCVNRKTLDEMLNEEDREMAED